MKHIPLTEQQILGVLYSNIEALETDYYKYFVTDIGQAIFKGLISLQEKDLTSSKRNLIIHSSKHYDKLESSHLGFLDEEFHLKDLKAYLEELKDYKTIKDFQTSKLENFTVEATKKQPDLDELESHLESMLHDISTLKSEGNEEEKFLSRHDETVKHKEIIDKRKRGVRYPSGDSNFDKFLYNGSLMPQETSVVFANSGSGKTTWVRMLNERRIVANLPTLEINLEMSLESSLDSKMAIRTKIDRKDFSISLEDEEEGLDNKVHRIEEALENELKRSKSYKYYYQLNIESMTLDQLVSYIKLTKKLMGLKPKDYLFISVDLMSMVKDFKEGRGSTADKYTEALDRLHEISKELNVHIMGVFQPKRPSDKVIINSVADTYKLKVSTEMLKNSGSIEERARLIISVFRPYYTLSKYCPDARELSYMEDVMEVNIIKQNNEGLSPTLYYLFDAPKGLLYYYPDYDPNIFEDEEDFEDEE